MEKRTYFLNNQILGESPKDFEVPNLHLEVHNVHHVFLSFSIHLSGFHRNATMTARCWFVGTNCRWQLCLRYVQFSRQFELDIFFWPASLQIAGYLNLKSQVLLLVRTGKWHHPFVSLHVYTCFFFREVSGDQHGWVVSANPKKYGWRLFYFEPHCWLPFMLFCAWTCLCIISWAFKIRIDKKTSRCLGMSQVRHVSLWNLGSAAGSSVRPWLREGQAFRESSRAREATKRCPAGFGHPPILEFPQMGVPQ